MANQHSNRARFGRAMWIIATVLTAGCYTMRRLGADELVDGHTFRRVWVTAFGNSIVVLDSATVRGYALIGAVRGKMERIRLSNASVLRVQEHSASRTASLGIAAGAAVVGFTVYFVVAAENDRSVAVRCTNPGCNIPVQ